jgi:electron transport complex protein RnfG
MYRAMVGVGLLCGFLIVSAYEFTRPVIARNRAEALQRAILQVLPEAQTSGTFRWADDHFEPAGEGAAGPFVHAGYGPDGQIVGLALEAQGMGYADIISILYGYSPEKEAVIGFRVLESKETPGLGDRIETDPDFLVNFEALDVSRGADGQTLAQDVLTVKHGTKTNPWEIDAITGATISSVAIGDMLRASTGVWVPRVAARLDEFREETS